MFKDGKQARRDLGEHTLFGSTHIYTLEDLPESVDLDSVIRVLEAKVPRVFFHEIDAIYIGQFKEFYERGINAFYSDGALFITNNQDSDEDLLDDIIHEVAHSVERMAPEYIYDLALEREFITKRKTLYHRLRADDWNIDLRDFIQPQYSEEFDDLLHQEIGYPILAGLTYDLFNSPYAITSLQEYWANGFEGFYVKDPLKIKALSPQIYEKIVTLTNNHK